MSDAAPPLDEDPRFQRLLDRGGMIALPLAAPDAWPHGPLPNDEKELAVGEDRHGRFVYVVEPTEEGFGQVHRREVRVGELEGGGGDVGCLHIKIGFPRFSGHTTFSFSR